MGLTRIWERDRNRVIIWGIRGSSPPPPAHERIIVVLGMQPAFGRCFVRMEKERKGLQLSFSFSFLLILFFFLTVPPRVFVM